MQRASTAGAAGFVEDLGDNLACVTFGVVKTLLEGAHVAWTQVPGLGHFQLVEVVIAFACLNGAQFDQLVPAALIGALGKKEDFATGGCGGGILCCFHHVSFETLGLERFWRSSDDA